MERSKAESFTAYLEAGQRSEREARNAPRLTGGTAFSVLVALSANPHGVMALSDLQRASDITFFEFSECLKRLMGVGYLTIDGSPGRETACISKLGAEVADLARPALRA